MTLDELMEALKTYDEVDLLEILDISSEDLIAAFEDRIIDRQDQLKEALGGTTTDETAEEEY